MLSIGIPVYNNAVLSLVERLHLEATSLQIPFEILICDDASTAVFQAKELALFSHTRLLKNEVNRHVAYTRNRLLAEAQYPWVLLLDADVFPQSTTFIQTYLAQRHHGLFFQGGFTYLEEAPSSLRVKYGLAVEQYKHLHSCCNLFFNQRELQLQFDDSISTYGYEDTLFFLALAAKGVAVIRLENRVIHNNTESNASYVLRTQQACRVLATLVAQQTLPADNVQLSKGYQLVKQCGLSPCIGWIDVLLGKWITTNLLGKNPSLFAFKLYKLTTYHKASLALQKK